MKIVLGRANIDWTDTHRRQRILLEQSDFYMTEDGGGVTLECRADIKAWRDTVRRIDHIFDHPDKITWPDFPAVVKL